MTRSEFETPGLVSTTILLGLAALFTLIYPPLGLAFALLGGWRLARRVVASGSMPVDLASPSYVLGGLRSVRWGLPAFGIAVAGPALRVLGERDGFLGDIQDLLCLTGPGAVVALIVFGAKSWKKDGLAAQSQRQHDVQVVAAIMGVAPSVIEQQAGLRRGPLGSIVINPVPPVAAAKLANRAALEQTISNVAPHLALDPSSSNDRIVLMPVDVETAQRRAALAESGGLLAGGLDAPVAYDEQSVEESSGLLRLTDEDLA